MYLTLCKKRAQGEATPQPFRRLTPIPRRKTEHRDAVCPSKIFPLSSFVSSFPALGVGTYKSSQNLSLRQCRVERLGFFGCGEIPRHPKRHRQTSPRTAACECLPCKILLLPQRCPVWPSPCLSELPLWKSLTSVNAELPAS